MLGTFYQMLFMLSLPRNVWVLSFSLALFMSLSAFVIFIGGIVGKSLAPNVSLATLPVALLVVGTVVSVVPTVRTMGKIGRRPTFLAVCVYTIVVLGLAILALQMRQFYVFCLATFLLGVTTATMNQFRFAAIESVDNDQAATATSIVLLGGLVAAFLGPELAVLGKDWFMTAFVGSFLLMMVVFVLAFILLLFFHPAKKFVQEKATLSRGLGVIIKQPVFIVAVSAAAIGYAVMSYLMTATPISMHMIDGHSLQHTKFVIQSHIVAMFLPSLFTSVIVRWLGLSRMMFWGVVLYAACVVVAYLSHAVINYWVSLVLLGLGWNFLFTGGTSLLPRAYKENERYAVQSANEFIVFGMQAIASLSAGWFVVTFGWEKVVLFVVPFLVAQAVLLLWWMKQPHE